MNEIIKIEAASRATKEYSSVISDLLRMLNNRFENINSKLDKIAEDIIITWFDYRDKIDENTTKVVNILFSLMLLGHIINILFIFPYKNQKKNQWARYCNHFAWMLITLLTIITFFLGAALGCIGILAKDSIPFMNFIFGEGNLLDQKYIFKDKVLAETLSVCLYHGGDLASELSGVQNSEVDFLNNLYLLRKSLKSVDDIDISELESYANPSSIISYRNHLLTYSDVTTITKRNDPNAPIMLLEELNKWSDGKNVNSYQKNCTTFINDQWVINKEKCNEGYIYANSQQSITNGTQCLVITEWTSDSIKSRYQSHPTGCNSPSDTSRYSNVKEAIYFYWAAIDNLSLQNTNLIADMETQLDIISEIFQNLVEKKISLTKGIELYTEGLNVLLSSNLKEGQDLYDVIDCSYLKNDLYVLYANLKDNLSKKALLMCIIFAALSLSNLIGQSFLVFYIIKNKQKVRKYELIDEEDKEVLKNNPGMIELKVMNLQK